MSNYFTCTSLENDEGRFVCLLGGGSLSQLKLRMTIRDFETKHKSSSFIANTIATAQANPYLNQFIGIANKKYATVQTALKTHIKA